MAIDGEWIRARLTGQRGEKARLADALGVTPDVVSKVLSGTRQLSATEAEAARAFFGEAPLTDLEENLLRWFRAATDEQKRMAQEFLRLAGGGASSVESKQTGRAKDGE